MIRAIVASMTAKTTGPSTGCLELNQAPPTVLRSCYFAAGISLAYVIFAIGCCRLILQTWWLRWRNVSPEQRVHRLRATVSRLCRWYLTYHSRLRLMSLEYRDKREITHGLIVANHPSLVDALWILATQPNACCVLKGDLRQSPLLRSLVEELDYVSNHDPEQLLAEGSRRLANGEALLVFPEATRTQPGQLPEFRLGAAELLVRSGAVVHPIVIHKTETYLCKEQAWYQFPRRPMRWRIDFMPPQQPDITGNARTCRRQITAQLQAFFHGCLRDNGCTDLASSGKSAHEHAGATSNGLSGRV